MPHISRRTSALAGLTLGPLWISVVIVVTWLEWDFLHSLGWGLVDNKEVPYPSATARGDFGLLQMLNFAVTGLLVAIFAVGFRREFRRKISGLVATAGLGLASLGLLLNVCPTDLPGEPTTWHGTAHGLGFAAFLLSMALTFGASGLALGDNPAWRGWRLLGWTPVLLLLIAFTGAGLPGDVSFYLFLAVGFGWYAAMGAHLFALDRATSNLPVASPVPEAAAPGLL
jgi:Protein of unknown function (DUF998)